MFVVLESEGDFRAQFSDSPSGWPDSGDIAQRFRACYIVGNNEFDDVFDHALDSARSGHRLDSFSTRGYRAGQLYEQVDAAVVVFCCNR